MVRPGAGLAIRSRALWLMRGGRKPLVPDDTSRAAELAGVVVPIPTPGVWAWALGLASSRPARANRPRRKEYIFCIKKTRKAVGGEWTGSLAAAGRCVPAGGAVSAGRDFVRIGFVRIGAERWCGAAQPVSPH